MKNLPRIYFADEPWQLHGNREGFIDLQEKITLLLKRDLDPECKTEVELTTTATCDEAITFICIPDHANEPEPQNFTDKVVVSAMISAFLSIPIFAVIGVIQTLRWIFWDSDASCPLNATKTVASIHHKFRPQRLTNSHPQRLPTHEHHPPLHRPRNGLHPGT